MNIELNPKLIFSKMLYFVLFLLLVNICGVVTKLYFGQDSFRMLVLLFDFDTEVNIPTLYSSFSLVIASFLLFIIASSHRRADSIQYYWFGLAVIFLFLAVDEIASVHERISAPVRDILDTSGFLYYAWVIPYGIALTIFVAIYFKFLVRLPKNIMFLFVISGAMFVTGSIGFELLGGRHAEMYGENNFMFCLLYTCEELLEMLGIVIFIHALLLYIASELKLLTITIYEDPPKKLESKRRP